LSTRKSRVRVEGRRHAPDRAVEAFQHSAISWISVSSDARRHPLSPSLRANGNSHSSSARPDCCA
jgi:hypothetical protein